MTMPPSDEPRGGLQRGAGEGSLNLFVGAPQLPAFCGYTYDPAQDFERLKTSLDKVRYLMLSERGRWWTLSELASRTGSSEAGVSARIRDLRKPHHGGFSVENKRMKGGLWKYRIGK
jgi:biotin operon repressor